MDNLKFKAGIRHLSAFFLSVFLFSNLNCQNRTNDKTVDSRIISGSKLEELMKKPVCLEGFRPNQSGPLSRIDAKEGEKDDSTFTVEKMKISSDGVLINGWLYLPKKEGKFPLVVLTNGGGDDSRRIKSLSDWMAPIFAHCGIAAFVHDKRGTGLSEGNFVETTYDDYITDAGNCALFLSHHERINPVLIGVAGGSEGGRIAVLTASRYPIIKFVISFAGTVVSTEEDRLYAQMGGYKSSGISDSLIEAVTPLWKKSFAAWASNNPEEHIKVNKEIIEWRKKYDKDILPFTKEEMDSIPEFRSVLSTWYSMPNDYLTELEHFNKKWLAIFGEVDKVVPIQASIKNIVHYMGISGNKNYNIAVIPKCGHAPVDIETKRLIRIYNLIINWLNDNVVDNCCN
jgi:pimeloyl-ACP methyl ester carboxylesterase